MLGYWNHNLETIRKYCRLSMSYWRALRASRSRARARLRPDPP
jgi:hypothetical protein